MYSLNLGRVVPAALFVLSISLASAGVVTFGPSAAGLAVPDSPLDGVGGGPVSTSILIPLGNDFVINPGNSISVTMTGLNHTFISDLVMTLTTPNGDFTMFNQVGGGCDFLVGNTYTFQTGGAAVGPCATLPSGTYDTEPGFSSSNAGVNINNTNWTLSIEDFSPFDVQGAGWTWSLNLDVSPATSAPEPATLATVFAGIAVMGIAAYRRRQ